MSVRLAIEKDIPVLEKMLADMGQLRSVESIRECLADPWITVVHEVGGVVDGFYFAKSLHLDGLKRVMLGPGGAPTTTYAAWLKVICEMGIFIEEEGVRRRPAEIKSQWWTVTRIWPDMPMRNFVDATFAFAPRTSQTKDGYVLMPDGAKEYWIRRDRLETKARSVVATL